MENTEKKRIIFTFICLFLMFVMVIAKAFYVQVINRDKLIAYSKSQIFRETKVYPNRGNIYDRNGSPLAINIQTYSIFTIPRNVKKGKRAFRKLSKIVPKLTYSKIRKKIRNRKRYTWIARKIRLDKEQVLKIKMLGKEVGGIYIESVPKRLYPNNELAAQTLGFVGLDNVGLSGIEYLFNKKLKGKAKITKYLKDAKGRAIKFESSDFDGHAQNIHLTIDKELQALSEDLLKEAVTEHNADKGGVGIIDVDTGEVLAVANYPSFNPNKLKRSNSRYRRLSFASDPFEPGSTLKVFTVASGLENKVLRPDTNYYCERGRYKIGKHYITEASSSEKFEWLSVSEIIEHSSNIGTTKIAIDLTYPKLKKTLMDFNLGKKTGIENPAESRGIFDSRENVPPLSLSNISFGQGVAVTGIQMLAAYAAIVNEGIYITPTLMKGKNVKSRSRRVISKKTASELVEMLERVVEKGTGKNARIPFFKIAGKTSTAQRVSQNGGYKGYVPGFVGFPTNVDNKFVIYVYIDNPKNKFYYGNSVAAPVFNKIAQHILYKNKDFRKVNVADKKRARNSVDYVKVTRSSSRIVGKGKVPNFIGLDKISVGKLAEKMNISLSHRGIGVVKSQIPLPGIELKKDTVVNVLYEPPKYE